MKAQPTATGQINTDKGSAYHNYDLLICCLIEYF